MHFNQVNCCIDKIAVGIVDLYNIVTKIVLYINHNGYQFWQENKTIKVMIQFLN